MSDLEVGILRQARGRVYHSKPQSNSTTQEVYLVVLLVLEGQNDKGCLRGQACPGHMGKAEEAHGSPQPLPGWVLSGPGQDARWEVGLTPAEWQSTLSDNLLPILEAFFPLLLGIAAHMLTELRRSDSSGVSKLCFSLLEVP